MSYAQQPWQPRQWQSGPSMLASHADRERAVDVLRAGFSEGRLPKHEFDQRVARAYQARTVGELGLLVADLPQGPVPMPAAAVPAAAPVPPMIPFVPQPPTNGKALASLVLGALTLVTFGVTGVPAVILGHMGRAEIRRTGEGGDGMAVSGLTLGWLSVAGWALLFVASVIG
jgi:hypothetical protein